LPKLLAELLVLILRGTLRVSKGISKFRPEIDESGNLTQRKLAGNRAWKLFFSTSREMQTAQVTIAIVPKKGLS